MNALMIATTDVTCKNLFVYAENNPVVNKDSNGTFIESGFDVVTLAGSIVNAFVNPLDPWAWACVVGDTVDLVPGVTGVGEAVKGLHATATIADSVKDIDESVNETNKEKDKVEEKKEIPIPQVLHPDLEHPVPEGPHWDYIPYKNGPQYRVMPDGTVVPK